MGWAKAGRQAGKGSTVKGLGKHNWHMGGAGGMAVVAWGHGGRQGAGGIIQLTCPEQINVAERKGQSTNRNKRQINVNVRNQRTTSGPPNG